MEVIDPRFEAFVGSIKPYNFYSQFGEDSVVGAIFARIEETNRCVVECGAGDGLFFSNSRRLIQQGWYGVLAEGDDAEFKRLLKLYPSPKEGAGIVNMRLEPDPEKGFDKIVGTFLKDTPDPDLLICDIDGGDYWLINQMLTTKPRVLMVEFDPNADPDFIPEPNGSGQAGLNAIIKLGYGKLYAAVCKTWCNVIFVRQDLADKLIEEPKNTKVMVHGHWIGDNEAVKSCGQCKAEIVKMEIANRQLAEILESDVTFGEPRERIIPQPKDRTRPNYVNPLSLDRNKGKTGLTAAIADLPGAQGYRANGIHPNGTGIIKIAAAMSTPRLGFLSNSDCILAALAQFGIPLARGEGAYWSGALSRSIESCLKHKPDYVLTIDYDTVFHSSDLAKLVCFLDDNPGIDVAIPLQMKREGGELLASSDGQVDLTQAGVQARQGHFGLTLFRASVFDRLGLPWFYERPGPDGRWNQGRIDADIGFWQNCRDHGVSVYLVLGVVVGHLELVATWPDQQLKTHYQSLNSWRDGEMKAPEAAFSRDRIQETIEHCQLLDMKD